MPYRAAMTVVSDSQVADLAERYLQLMLRTDPLEATLIGFREHDGDLADLSVEHEAAIAEQRRLLRDEALALDPTALGPEDAITRAVILAIADYAEDAQAVDALAFTVAAFPVSPASILLAYLRMVAITDATQADAYLSRLSQVPRFLVQAEARLALGREVGLLPVAHLVQMAIDQIDRFLAADPCPLAIDVPDDVDDAWYGRLADVLDRDVRPAFTAHREHLRDRVLPTARSADAVGLLHLPDGLERYRRLVRLHTTTERTPQELHQVGLDMVARIHDEFRVLGAQVLGVSEPSEVFARLQEDPALRWGSADEILQAAESAVRRAEAVSVDWFGRLPAAVCSLAAIPEVEAEGAAPAYYMPPALDGSRPGTYFTNVNRPEERTSFDLESVAFHEAVPGHHFQISIALELPDLPVLRRLPMFTAYAEGWGLYSERLADEMGLYSSPLQRLGMLSADVWRAARLVVDTGMHAFGWTRQQAVDYLLENTPVAPIDVESEIDRYIAYPAQALSYMTGRLELERLRTRAESALGDAFDIKAFHDTALGHGALPLSVLGEVVDAWIAEQG
jgi:uncharacterized protein (DUF885 family)